MDPRCHHGVLALGDSITHGGGELQWGVALQSWALWTARGLGLPYTGLAVDGATVRDVVEEQIPRLRRTCALGPRARYHLGCLYVGVNDVRRPDWDAAAFSAGWATAAAFLAERCERVLAVSPPHRLGRPAAPAELVGELRAVLGRGARESGALLLDLGDFGARNQVMADRIHPTAFGQIAIAERALAVLGAAGMQVRQAPAALISYQTTWSGRLRGELRYAARVARETLRGLAAAG